MVFLVGLYLAKNGLPFKNKEASQEISERNALVYGDATVADLVYKDTDLDGVADWEEALWGLDPSKRETVPGTPDSSTVNKLKSEQTMTDGGNPIPSENLTETDKFSRELLSTVATLNQTGAMDQMTVDKISESLAEHIQNPAPGKIYTFSDIRLVPDSTENIAKYGSALEAIHRKYPPKGNVLDVLKRFIIDENNVDVGVLTELNPILEQTDKIITALAKIDVPQSVSLLHLDFLNGLQRSYENVRDIRLYDTDVIVALSAISQYDKNNAALMSATINLTNALDQKLNN